MSTFPDHRRVQMRSDLRRGEEHAWAQDFGDTLNRYEMPEGACVSLTIRDCALNHVALTVSVSYWREDHAGDVFPLGTLTIPLAMPPRPIADALARYLTSAALAFTSPANRIEFRRRKQHMQETR